MEAINYVEKNPKDETTLSDCARVFELPFYSRIMATRKQIHTYNHGFKTYIENSHSFSEKIHIPLKEE